MWFPRLPSDRVLRACPTDRPFALTLRADNTDRIYCLNAAAEAQGLHRGMGLAEARIFCPGLEQAPADPAADSRMLGVLRRWATRYCPWVGRDGRDGLALDITGSAHLAGANRRCWTTCATGWTAPDSRCGWGWATAWAQPGRWRVTAGGGTATGRRRGRGRRRWRRCRSRRCGWTRQPRSGCSVWACAGSAIWNRCRARRWRGDSDRAC